MTENLHNLAMLLADDDATRKIEAAVTLVRAMGDSNEEVRESVAAALEDLGPPPLDHLPELARLLEDPNPDVGYWAATLLGRLGKAGGDAVLPLINAISDANREKTSRRSVRAVVERSVWALGKIGPPAAGALPVLRELLEKLAESPDNPRLTRLATAAIEQIDRQ